MTTLALFLMPALAWSAPFERAPDGYTLVAEDDCGDPDAMPHVVRGKAYVFSRETVTAPLQDRDIVFDNEFCLLRYEKL
ncbi:MAG: hypothetical protein FJX75_25440, partial [Armatimonadetes bacterium]|nr:hypothetical protein [Armatimonadota bacterium]